jgi:hypothetical protein
MSSESHATTATATTGTHKKTTKQEYHCWFIGCKGSLAKCKNVYSIREKRNGKNVRLSFCSEGCVELHKSKNSFVVFECICCEKEVKMRANLYLTNDFQDTCRLCSNKCRREQYRLF